MTLQLVIENPEFLRPAVPREFVCRNESVTIADGREADWELLDRNHPIAKARCSIDVCDGSFWLRPLSGHIELNGAPLGREALCQLRDGDLLTVGRYHLRAYLKHMAAPRSEHTACATLRHGPRALDPEETRLESPAVSAARSIEASPSSILRAFAKGAGIEAARIEKKSDEEFAESLGRLFAIMLRGLMALLASKTEMRSLMGFVSEAGPAESKGSLSVLSDPQEAMRAIFASPRPNYPSAAESVQELFEALNRHDSSYFISTQVALFRLLNELAPETIEQDARRPFLGSADAAAWRRFVSRWAELNDTGENGLLDFFLHHMREAYDEEFR